MRGLTLAALGLLALAGIAAGPGQQPEAAAPAQTAGIASEAMIAAATRAVQARMPQRQDPLWDQARLFRFGPEDERALCGRIRLAEGAEPQDVILRILLPRGQARRVSVGGARLLVVMEAGPGLQQASYNASTRYCREAGEAPPALPVASSTGSVRTGAAEAPRPAESAPPPMPQATVRSPARLREAAHGSAPVLRVAAPGEAFQVFAFGPGGWLQVGEGSPQGWIHGSLLEVRR